MTFLYTKPLGNVQMQGKTVPAFWVTARFGPDKIPGGCLALGRCTVGTGRRWQILRWPEASEEAQVPEELDADLIELLSILAKNIVRFKARVRSYGDKLFLIADRELEAAQAAFEAGIRADSQNTSWDRLYEYCLRN